MPKKVFIARFRSLPFKHWALYIQMGGNAFHRFELSGPNYMYSNHTDMVSNPEEFSTYMDRIEVGTMASRNVEIFQQWAENQEIRKHCNWHCQNWAYNLIETLMDNDVIAPKCRILRELTNLRESLQPAFDPDRPRRLDPEHEIELEEEEENQDN